MTRYPLTWPSGWRRTPHEQRTRARFGKKSCMTNSKGSLSIAQATERVVRELLRLGDCDFIISTNLELSRDGTPRSIQSEPRDPGVAVYWKQEQDVAHKVMAVDQYDRAADNLAAIAATLFAMRAIERYGGAVILERAFTGFLALPAPNTWRSVFDIDEDVQIQLGYVRTKFKSLAKVRHPDNGGSDAKMAELNWAMAEAERELSL